MKVSGGAESLVQCASSAFAAGTCTWAPIGTALPAGTTFDTFDSDADHLYAQTRTSAGVADVLRIAK